MTQQVMTWWRLGCAMVAAATFVAGAMPARAQISGASAVKNAGNSPDNYQDGVTESFQRTSTVAILVNNGTQLTTRFAHVNGADVGIFTGTTNNFSGDYTVSFTATAPGAYDLLVTTSLAGAFTVVDDGDGPANADLSGVTGTATGGTLVGSINLADPGSRGSAGNSPFNVTNGGGATIQGSSNGIPRAHSLRFTFGSSCSSSNGFLFGGDECAVRLGLPITYGGQTAGNYPGPDGQPASSHGHFVSIQFVSLCGNGTIDVGRGEQCDQGALNGQVGSCCTSTCQILPAGTVCRASGGVCDFTEICDGTTGACPADGKSTAVCRASAGVCDVAESCDGVNDNCPANGFLPSFIQCRAAAGACDAIEFCTGSGAACPADAKLPSGTVCRLLAGGCDVVETCSGSSNDCPADQLAPNGTVCRAAAGICDVAETCSGGSAQCPSNAAAPPGTPCRAAAGICDLAETCNGVGVDCPADVFLGSTSGVFVCRPAAGPCDAADACDGTGPSCPADAKLPSGASCRPAAGVCDLPESCDGANDPCPADGFRPSGFTCRASAGMCDVAETCTGSGPACPADAFAPSSTTCRAAAGVCDVAETCTGSSASCPADAKSTATCRPAAGPCDAAESCNGSSNSCPADQLQPNTFACRPAVGTCDVAELCSGVDVTCPADSVSGAFVECRPSTGPCDVAEFCDGSSGVCPTDVGGADGDSDGVCDVTDVCPSVSDPAQLDGDNDDVGDECDPCTNIVPTTQIKAKVTVSKLLAPAGDDKLKFSGSFAGVPATPTVDPIGNGIRIILTDALGGTIVDATLPGGAYDAIQRVGWSVNGSGTSWKYKNAGTSVALIGGIYKVSFKRQSTPGLYKFSIGGKNGSYAGAAANLPLTATLVIDSPIARTGQCGEATFPGPAPFPRCLLVPSGSTLKCK